MWLYLIRHGHRADEEPGYTGGSNPPLSELGRKQAQAVADFMANKEISALYCSPMLRSLETTQPLQARLQIPMNVWPAFCEVTTEPAARRLENDPTLIERLAGWLTPDPAQALSEEEIAALDGNYYLLSSVAKKYAGVELSQPFPWPDAWWTALDGECRESAFTRVELGIRGVLARHGGEDRVVISGHGNATDMAIALLMEMPRDRYRRVSTAHGCISCIEFHEAFENPLLAFHNYVDHIPEENRTR